MKRTPISAGKLPHLDGARLSAGKLPLRSGSPFARAARPPRCAPTFEGRRGLKPHSSRALPAAGPAPLRSGSLPALKALRRAAPATVRIRPARLADLDLLEAFISRYTHDGTLLPRTRANLVQHLRDFRVAWMGDRLVGCGALQLVDATLAEVRSVAVDPSLQGRGIGRRLVGALVADARRLGLPRVFCLTRRLDFFAHQGFVAVPMGRYPHKVWNDCRLCPRRHRCDETAMERPLTAAARRALEASLSGPPPEGLVLLPPAQATRPAPGG